MVFERCENGLRNCYRGAFIRSAIKVGHHPHCLARECIGFEFRLSDSKGGESNDEDQEEEWKETGKKG